MSTVLTPEVISLINEFAAIASALEVPEFMQTVPAHLERMSAITSQLLAIARADTGTSMAAIVRKSVLVAICDALADTVERYAAILRMVNDFAPTTRT